MTRDTFEAWLQDLGRPLPDGLGQDLSSRPQGSDWDFRSDLQRPGSQPGFALLVLPRRTQEPGTSGTNILGNLSKRSQKWFLGVREPTAPRTQEPSRSNPGTTPKSNPGTTQIESRNHSQIDSRNHSQIDSRSHAGDARHHSQTDSRRHCEIDSRSGELQERRVHSKRSWRSPVGRMP